MKGFKKAILLATSMMLIFSAPAQPLIASSSTNDYEYVSNGDFSDGTINGWTGTSVGYLSATDQNSLNGTACAMSGQPASYNVTIPVAGSFQLSGVIRIYANGSIGSLGLYDSNGNLVAGSESKTSSTTSGTAYNLQSSFSITTPGTYTVKISHGGSDFVFYTFDNISLLGPTPPANNLSINNAFTSNMVLQREKNIKLWGNCDVVGATQVTVTFNNQTKTGPITDGKWEVTLDAMVATATGSDLKVVAESKEIVVSNVVVGDVWLCSGQSNMEWQVGFADKGNGLTEDGYPADPNSVAGYQAIANNPNIRVLNVPETSGATPQTEFIGNPQWFSPDTQTIKQVSSYAFGFANAVQKDSNIPIGIIVSARGATTIEQWLPDTSLQSLNISRDTSDNNHKYSFYNAMINPLKDISIKGLVWYQGEHNAFYNFDQYPNAFAEYLRVYRGLFNDSNLPAIVVQLVGITPNDQYFSDFRLMQWKLMNNPYVYTVCGIDMGSSSIHPTNKLPYSTRAGDLALNKTYGKTSRPGLSAYPSVATYSDGKIILSFNNASSGLEIKDNAIKELYLSNAAGDKVLATAKIMNDNQLEISTDNIANPTKIEFCTNQSVQTNFYAKNGLPVAPFKINAPANQTQTDLIVSGIPTNVHKGDTFTVTVSGGSGTGTISYSSSDTNVASVSSSGLVTIKEVGSFTITVSKNSSTGFDSLSKTSSTIHVTDSTLDSSPKENISTHPENPTTGLDFNLFNTFVLLILSLTVLILIERKRFLSR